MSKFPRLVALFSYAACTALSFSCNYQESTTYQPLPTLILQADSGYVTRKELFPFLLTAGLTDSIDSYWEIKFPGNDDTVGKYYPSNSNGNTIVLAKFLNKQDSIEHLILMELRTDGTLLQHTIYSITDEWCNEDALRSFRKTGKFFMITGCGHGSGYSSEFKYIFDRIIPEDSIARIYFSTYRSYGIPQRVSSAIIQCDTILKVHYTIAKGSEGSNGRTQWTTANESDVSFFWRNNEWVAEDSAILKEMDVD